MSQLKRSFVRKLGLSATAVAAAFLLIGCGTTNAGESNSSGDDKVIAINFPGATKNVIVQAALDSVKELAAEEGYSVIVDDPESDLNKQLNTLTTWIQQGVDVIVVQPIAPESVESIAVQANAAGVGWVTYGVQMENQNGFVGFDHMQQAEALVQLLADWAEDNPKVTPKVALLTLQSIEWARQREEGLDAALTKLLPGVEIVARQDALSQSEGLTAMSTILQGHPDVNVVLAISDTATEGAYQALLNNGREADDPNLFVGGMDGSATAFELLAEGTFYRGSAAIDSKTLAQAVADVAISVAGGKDADKLIVATAVVPKDPRIPELLGVLRG